MKQGSRFFRLTNCVLTSLVIAAVAQATTINTVTGTYGVSYVQTGPLSATSSYYSSINLALNEYDEPNLSANFPASITFSSPSSLLPGNQLTLTVSSSWSPSNSLDGPNFNAYTLGGLWGMPPNDGFYVSASLLLFAQNKVDLDTSLSLTINGGNLDGFQKTISGASPLPLIEIPLLSAAAFNSLATSSVQQPLTLDFTQPLNAASDQNANFALFDLTSNSTVISSGLDQHAANLYIPGNTLQAGHDYYIVYQIDNYSAANQASDHYTAVNYLTFTASVPDASATLVMLSLGVLGLAVFRRRVGMQ